MFLATCLVFSCGGGGGGSSSSTPPATGSNPQPTTEPELSSVTPTQFDLDVSANASVAAQLSISNSGDAALTYDLTSPGPWLTLDSGVSGSVAAGATTTIDMTVNCASNALSGNLMLATNDSDEASVTVPVAATCAVASSAFEISKVTLNQAARLYDSSQSGNFNTGIVADRELLVRAFVTGDGAPPSARVVISRSGSPNQTFAMHTPPSIGATPASDGALTASHYVVVPAGAIQSGSTLSIEATGASTVTFPESAPLDLSVDDPGEFQVTLVPVTYQGQTPTIVADDYMRQSLELLPVGSVDIEVRAPYVFTGNYDLDRLLEETADLRDLDGSSRLYHAIIIPPGGSTSGTAGIGYVGYPVSVSIDLGGTLFVIAHEIGHNLNLGHAPGCNAPGADANYPYAEGAVETWGFNITQDALVAPTANRRDFMTYCGDLWVSDYHFDRALNYRNQTAPSGNAPPSGAGLTISGRLSNGVVSDVTLMPTESVSASMFIDGQSLPYEFIAWDQLGRRIVNHAFAAHRVEDRADGLDAQAFIFSVPAPAAPIHHYEIKYRGTVIDAAGMAPLAPVSQAAVTRQADRTQISWAPEAGQAIVIRDDHDRVVSVDRTGLVVVPGRGRLSAQVVGGGMSLTNRAGINLNDTQVQWLR